MTPTPRKTCPSNSFNSTTGAFFITQNIDKLTKYRYVYPNHTKENPMATMTLHFRRPITATEKIILSIFLFVLNPEKNMGMCQKWQDDHTVILTFHVLRLHQLSGILNADPNLPTDLREITIGGPGGHLWESLKEADPTHIHSLSTAYERSDDDWKICPQCSAIIESNHKFCCKCGEKQQVA